MLASTARSLAAALTLAAAPAAIGQHANFILFGDPDPQGLELPAERRAVHPVTSPYFHEDSFVTTDIRPVFIAHNFPGSSVIDGGDAKVYALQIRVALTEELQFVAYKDGYTDFDTGLLQDDGFNDVAAGVKWNFLQDWDNDLHSAVGIGFQAGVGDDNVLQQDDELRFWTSINKGFDRLHLGGTANLFVPTDAEDVFGDSVRTILNLHADYYVCEWFSPLVEVNGYFTIDEGDNTPLPFSGVDVANLGADEGGVVTLGAGGEFRPCPYIHLRAAYEFPLTNNDDLFGDRWTVSAVIDF